MDIADIKPIERTVSIKHPGNGEPLGITVSFMSLDDDRMKPVVRKMTDRGLQLRQKGKVPKSDEVSENEIALLAAATTGWDWSESDVTFHGEKPDFNTRNVTAVYTELPWFKKQIDDEIGETKDFFTS